MISSAVNVLADAARTLRVGPPRAAAACVDLASDACINWWRTWLLESVFFAMSEDSSFPV